MNHTPCGSHEPTPCRECDGKGWVFFNVDTGNDNLSRYEIKRCEDCDILESDLAAFEAVEKITVSQPALLRFVEKIAAIKHEGEPGDDGPFEFTSEDAIAT